MRSGSTSATGIAHAIVESIAVGAQRECPTRHLTYVARHLRLKARSDDARIGPDSTGTADLPKVDARRQTSLCDLEGELADRSGNLLP